MAWLKISEEDVKTDYQRNIIPDPYNYHYNSAPTVDPASQLRIQIPDQYAQDTS